MSTFIHNGTIITMNNGKIIHQGAIAIEGDKITDVGKTSELVHNYGRGYQKIDAKGKVIIPGLVNTHQHAAMSLLRGYADDLPLQEWLEKWIWPIEKHMTPHDIYIGAQLTAIESIIGGTTTVNTMYHYTQRENEARAFAEIGLRGVIGHVCFSWRKKEDKKALESLARNWHNKADGTIRTSVDPHAPYTVDPDYMKQLKAIQEELNSKHGCAKHPVILHMHVAETANEVRKTQETFNIQLENGIMRYLDSLGTLDEHTILSHCVAITARDIAVMKRREVKASHNPISNLKLASGVCPVPEMLKGGITVSLGTDSSCSNNSADMFEVMKTAALLHKGTSKDPTVLPAERVLEMATVDGARSLCWEDEIGTIEIGKKADLAIVGFNKPHLCPLYNEISHLVYAAKAADVETVFINGKMVMEDRKLTIVNTERIIAEANKVKDALLAKLRTNA